MTFGVTGWSGGARVPVNYDVNTRLGGGGQRGYKVYNDTYHINIEQRNYGASFEGYDYGNNDCGGGSKWTDWLMGLGALGQILGGFLGGNKEEVKNDPEKKNPETTQPEKKTEPEKPKVEPKKEEVTATAPETTKTTLKGTITKNIMYDANKSNQKLWAQLANLFERADGKPMTYADGLNIKHAIDNFYGHDANDVSFANGGKFDLTAIDAQLADYNLRGSAASQFNDALGQADYNNEWENTQVAKDAGYTATIQDNHGSGTGATADEAKTKASNCLDTDKYNLNWE